MATQNQQTLPAELGQVIDFIEASSALAEKAAAAEEAGRERAARLDLVIPGLVAKLAELRVPDDKGVLVPAVGPNQKQAAEDALRDPERAVGIVAKLAECLARLQPAAAPPAALGRGVAGEKRAGIGPYAGHRRDETQSDNWARFQNAILNRA